MKLPFSQGPGVTTYYHENPDEEGFVLEKVFDREPVLDHCQYMRNEVKQTGELRKVMSVPTPLIFQWMREGKLGEQAFVDGKLVIDKQTMTKLMREYSALACVDKL